MPPVYPENWPQFFTATIADWAFLLREEKYKNVIITSLQYLVRNRIVRINAFVIMSNHVHFIWQAMGGYNLHSIQISFKKFTSHQFIKHLSQDKKLMNYEVSAADRKHHFWKRNSLGIELFSPAVFNQKLTYIHNNPVAAGLCKYPESYKYSSASFYNGGADTFGILEHYLG